MVKAKFDLRSLGWDENAYCIGGFSLQTVVFASWWDYLQTICKVSKGSLKAA
jgi:hypothetical protein